jgi:HMG (high mobility group) box
MNRPEHVLYNYDYNEATNANVNEATVAENNDGTSEKTTALTNPMQRVLQSDFPLAVAAGNLQSANMDGPINHPTILTEGNMGSSGTTAPHIDLKMPKRNLSSYNLFFQVERENIINGEDGMNYTHENIARVALRHYQQGKLDVPRRKHRKTHGKISFAELARSVAARWKLLDPSVKEMFVHRTNIEKAQYQKEIGEWADRKLRAKPQPPQRETPLESVALTDVYIPDDRLTTNRDIGETTRSSSQLDIMLHPESIMPLRMFRPSTSMEVFHAQQHTSDPSNREQANYAGNLSQFSSGMGWANPMNQHDFSQQQNTGMSDMMYQSTAPDFSGMQQYQQFTLQPNHMSLQQQFNMMNEMHGLSYAHTQAQFSTHGYPNSLSMRSPLTAAGQPTMLRSEGFVSLPNQSNTSYENYHANMQHQPAFGNVLNLGEVSTIGEPQMSNEGKSDETENQDFQALFNRYNVN